MVTLGCSVKGASHIRTNKPCQDYHLIYNINEQNKNYVILAVADGHGSSHCPFSQDGAEVAAQIFCDLIGEYCRQNNLEYLQTFLNRDGKIIIPKEIENSWKQQVINFHRQNNREIPVDKSEEKIYSQYGTTLLGLLITKNFVYAFQLGDGDIICVTQDEIFPLIIGDYLLGVETFSLSNKNAWKYATGVTFSRTEDNFQRLYILSTDGFSNSHATQTDFYKTCKDYYELFVNRQQDYVKENLKQWLNETSLQGCGDDITVVFAFDENLKGGFDAPKISSDT